MIHQFRESLERSNGYSDAPWWLDVYRQAFPTLASCVSVRNDGWAQRAGIDRVITLACGRVVRIDEKVREKDWPDFCLEYWSDYGSRIRGWVCKDLACDFIAYAFAPTKTCYLLPTLSLRRAWRSNCLTWIRQFDRIEANNGTYVTVSVAVPKQVLLDAIRDAMVVTWSASNDI